MMLFLHVQYVNAWQVILTTLLKVYVRGGLFEKSRELLTELEALGYAEDEVNLKCYNCRFVSLSKVSSL